MRRICLTLPSFFSRMPNSSFILSDTMEPKDGSRAGDKLISGLIGEGWSMVHLPYGGGVDFDIGAALPGSTEYRARWMDPRTGGREISRKEKCVLVQSISRLRAKVRRRMTGVIHRSAKWIICVVQARHVERVHMQSCLS
jgi:hypothetical protein